MGKEKSGLGTMSMRGALRETIPAVEDRLPEWEWPLRKTTSAAMFAVILSRGVLKPLGVRLSKARSGHERLLCW